MLFDAERGVINRFKEAIRTRFPGQILDMILFGSRTRGVGHEGSDIDILVLVREEERVKRREIYDVASELFLNYEVNISPICYGEEQVRVA
jgi:predicted nucleotidyltransferase